MSRRSAAPVNLLQNVLSPLFRCFFENFLMPLAFTAGASNKNVRAREIVWPLLVPSASFRALWCRQLEDPGDRGTAWFSRDRWRDTLFRQRPSSNGLGSVSHASLRFPPSAPLHDVPYLPTPQSRSPGFGVSANSSFFSRFLSLGGRDYWEAEEF